MFKIRKFLQKKKKIYNNAVLNKGKYAEEVAAKYLIKNNHLILHRNFLCKLGEIDIIALDKKTIIFVEVKYRSQKYSGNAAESITSTKQKKIIKAAQYWINQYHYQNSPIRFDAILFDKTIDYNHLTWLKAAF